MSIFTTKAHTIKWTFHCSEQDNTDVNDGRNEAFAQNYNFLTEINSAHRLIPAVVHRKNEKAAPTDGAAGNSGYESVSLFL